MLVKMSDIRVVGKNEVRYTLRIMILLLGITENFLCIIFSNIALDNYLKRQTETHLGPNQTTMM